MEFSLFWLSLLIFFLGSYELLKKVFLFLKSRQILIVILFLFSLSLSIFHWMISIIFSLYLFIPAVLFWFYRDKLFNYKLLSIYFIAVLIISSILYIPVSDNLWLQVNEKIYSYFSSSSRIIKGLMEIYTVAQFFRFLYPSLFSFFFFLFFAYISSKNLYSFWYRLFKNFKHNFAYWSVSLWIIFAFLSVIAGQKANLLILSNIILNIALFFTYFYTMFGLLLIFVFLRKNGIKYTLPSVVLFVIFTVSGSYLPLIFFALSGIGITDIWMNYRNIATTN